jgi:hypothetical protein
MKWIVALLVLLGAVALVIAVIERLFGFLILGVSPAGFMRFANTAILLGIGVGIFEWRWHRKE